ncbi:MAG: serine hydrolase domain-containing protein [Promethearchaeota archaeon]
MDLSLKIDALDALLEGEFSRVRIPGLSIGVVQDGELKYYRGFGYSNLELQVPVGSSTVFRVASISKVFTTIGLLQQWEAGMFELEDPVNDYLPAGKIRARAGWPQVTFKHLFTHRSGIGELFRKRDVFKRGFGILVKGRDTPVPPLSSLHDRGFVPDVAAGSKYAYSNIGFSLLGYLLEVFSGMDFRDYICKHILDPLGMERSDFNRTERVIEWEAQGYKRARKKYKHSSYPKNIIKPAGNLYTNVEDMSKLATCLINGGKHENGQLLEPGTIKLAWTPHYWSHDAIKDQSSIGLCFHLYNAGGKAFVEHTGATSGFTSGFTMVPEDKLGLFVFSNIDEIFGSRGTLLIKNRILQHLYDIPESKKEPVKVDKTTLKRIAGYYGPNPGILSNTRVLASAGDYKISSRKGIPHLSSFYGGKRKGIPLIATDDPLVYEYKLGPGAAIKRAHIVAFTANQEGEASKMNIGFFNFRKNKFWNTFRFKIYCLVVFLLILISILIMMKIMG